MKGQSCQPVFPASFVVFIAENPWLAGDLVSDGPCSLPVAGRGAIQAVVVVEMPAH